MGLAEALPTSGAHPAVLPRQNRLVPSQVSPPEAACSPPLKTTPEFGDRPSIG